MASASASASSSRSDGVSLARIQSDSVAWASEHVSFDYFATQVREGLIDMNPEHQREVVHTDEWQGQIILSAITTGDIPELYFDEVLGEDGVIIKRSLDGKQRGTAIVRFINGDIPFPKKAKISDSRIQCLAGKKITDLTPQNQSVIKNLKIHYKVANRMLTDDEVTEFFLKRQNTKVTKHGEFLNSNLSSNKRNFIIKDMLERPDVESAMDIYRHKIPGTLKRSGDLELIAKCLYHYTHMETNHRIDVSIGKLKTWWSSRDEIDNLTKVRFIARFLDTIAFIDEYSIANPGKSVLLPIFAYICKYRADMYLRAYFTHHKKFEGDVAGDHGASRARFEFLVSLRT